MPGRLRESAELLTVPRWPVSELPPPFPFIHRWSSRHEWLTAAGVTLAVAAVTLVGGPALYASRVPVIPLGMVVLITVCGFLPSFAGGLVAILVLNVMLANGDAGELLSRASTTRFVLNLVVLSLMAGIGEALKRSRVRAFNRLRSLRESEARYRSILEDANEGIVLLDAARERVLVANNRAAEALGVTRERLMGISVRELVHAQGVPELTDWLYGSAGAESAEVQRRYTRPDGTIRVLHVSGRRLVSGAVQALIRDVTERVIMERAMEESKRLEAVGRLAGGIAHDFNNILQAVRLSAEDLRSMLAPGDAAIENADGILDAATRARRLVSSLLTFSHKQESAPELLAVDAHVRSFEPMLRRLVGASLTFETSLAASDARILVDIVQFEQVLMNLTVNARDSMDDGGTLRLETALVSSGGASADDAVRLRVSDTGGGIPDEVRPHIFEPYFTTKGGGKGTGLGLATVHAIAQRYGASVTVDSAPGSGTTFTLVFPIAR